jgi:hypothetical protein
VPSVQSGPALLSGFSADRHAFRTRPDETFNKVGLSIGESSSKGFQSPHQRRVSDKPEPRFDRKHGGVFWFDSETAEPNNVDQIPGQIGTEAPPAQPEGGPAEPET